ncbi:putative 4'-phosphopantetheinyl transferase [Actinoplanes cyaneus]|uniref:4'-phosphopantetheinyl transferase n=1 Tax=Actinoplanes cyaneus TaxID=52696 RepID=A0A919MCR7_9ACTN|nr:4'-phosphopantetheinyl transferase superfamily protein [Actinoplanes cyaneus]MCW2144192.1 4'-phosphopantetheinyl transferase EntD (siderophore biosynthesis) [Actinoplanes cyaneus]GID70954.1 putative 4'-phosphopantetheinyl transferase [Actinoplanes cyaneus]
MSSFIAASGAAGPPALPTAGREMTGLLAELLPEVATCEVYADPPGIALFPAEQQMIASAVEKRRREFTTVRHCARTALRELGIAPVPILPGERGAPGWPPGVVGSMTHCAGFRGCAVALAGHVRTIGVDAEPAAPLPDGVLEAIALPEEHVTIKALGPGVPADRILFSAKESVYKAWFPLTRRFLQFHEARIELDPNGVFTATLLADPPLPVTEFQGRWRYRSGLVVTGIVVPA